MALVAKRDSFKNAIKRINSKHPSDKKLSKSVAVATLDILNGYWNSFLEIHMEIEAVSGKNELEFQYIELNSVEDIYITLKARLLVAIDNQAPADAHVQVNTPPGVATPTGKAFIKLPQIELPKFDGNYQQWTSFHDLFSSIINTNSSLSGSQKLHYLKANVIGEAAQIIRSYQITNENYKQAWDALIERYSNKRIIITSYLKTLFNQNKLQYESPSDLRKLLDDTTESIRSLQIQGLPTDRWDSMVVFLVEQKMDLESHRQWELSLKRDDLPTFKQISEFIENRCRALEAVMGTTSKNKGLVSFQRKSSTSSNSGSKACLTTSTTNCPICNGSHTIYTCPTFKSKTVLERHATVRKAGMCFNCLNKSHSVAKCISSSCRLCNGRHHTMLHHQQPNQQPSNNSQQQNVTSEATSSDSIVQSNLGVQNLYKKEVLLATALLKIRSSNGNFELARALLDSGSQATIITEACAQRLMLSRKRSGTSVLGVGSEKSSSSRGSAMIEITSCNHSSFNLSIEALILPKITNFLPTKSIQVDGWTKLQNLQLADPKFYESAKIDVLIGADAYGALILDGIININEFGAIAQNTRLGWIITGPVNDSRSNVVVSCHTNLELESNVRKFWEVEEVIGKIPLSNEDMLCEKIFDETHTRNEDGRFVVHLPFKNNVNLGLSRPGAIRRLLQMEKRFSADPELRNQYSAFMEEYENLHHMELASDIGNTESLYLPHHGVIKTCSTTTKLRVVFDGSSKTSNGQSLNNFLMVGPRLQDDLVDIVVRFRSHAIALTCDIVKMYRQVLVHSEHQNYQRIVWRKSPDDSIRDYVLKTVTYGLVPSQYLAVKSLQQLAKDESANYPAASTVIQNDFYVDDLMTGCKNEKAAIELRTQLLKITALGGLELQKWYSNSRVVLGDHHSWQSMVPQPINLDESFSVKTLGLLWYPQTDMLGFSVSTIKTSSPHTKRSVLSDIARLFDPLGILAPCIIAAKILMQEMWCHGLDWDTPLPIEMLNYWLAFRSELKTLELVKIPRFFGAEIGPLAQIHGFCDASQKAYAAVIYLRLIDAHGNVSVSFVISKTRVAPLKELSIPRLELCAALLLAKLLRNIRTTLGLTNVVIYTWSDSQDVLYWLQKQPNNWGTFVANRVATIQTLTDIERWRYVPTERNPADIASRGVTPAGLIGRSDWWNPSWLSDDESTWPLMMITNRITAEERRRQVHCGTTVVQWNFYERFSSLTHLVRVTAYILRFIKNIRRSTNKNHGFLSYQETHDAMLFWVKRVQQNEFEMEIKSCLENKSLPKKSSLLSLSPFIGPDGLLRVGGRLSNSKLGFNRVHQIIIPKHHHLTDLLISDIHLKGLHGGTQLVLAMLRQRYWIVGARSYIRQQIHKCLPCFRQKKATAQQIMGNLPLERTQPTRAFFNAGVDFAGPILLKLDKGRSQRTYKGYISVFVCFSTRAIHLEVVSELTSNAFLAAFRRFVSRRGKCGCLFSDCGTNFVGARRQMDELRAQLLAQHDDDTTRRNMLNEGTDWKFIPPGSPHFGGLWEAGVKSVKFHLKRVLSTTPLTFEEMATTLACIEASLNSRPLYALTDDAKDDVVLTPGHFLIGEPLTAMPEPSYLDIPVGRNSRWQLLQRLGQQFWKRWQLEYLTQLQQRTKWQTNQRNLKVGDLVLVVDERMPPAKWRVARVTELHPGADGKVRVVSISFGESSTKRAIHKLSPLPIIDNN